MSNFDKDLVIAAENGELEKVKVALENGASPDAKGPLSGALHVSSYNGFSDIVKLLLKKGANTEVRDHQNFTPLHLAASKGHVAVCNALIKAGADLEATSDSKGTALHIAAVSNQVAVTNALVKAGSNLEALDQYKESPMFATVWMGNKKIISNLIKAGSNINAINVDGDNILIASLRALYDARIKSWQSVGQSGTGSMVKYEIIKGCFRHTLGYDANNKEQLGYVLSLKDQRYCANKSWGPKEHLKYLDIFDTTKMLLKLEFDINAVGRDNQTAMGAACAGGEAKLIEAVYKAGGSFDNITTKGATPLHSLCSSGRLDGLEMFFKLCKDYDINAKDNAGWTPLHYLADAGGHPLMAKLLLSKGADKNIKSTAQLGRIAPGANPADVALHWKDQDMADLLKV